MFDGFFGQAWQWLSDNVGSTGLAVIIGLIVVIVGTERNQRKIERTYLGRLEDKDRVIATITEDRNAYRNKLIGTNVLSSADTQPPQIGTDGEKK
jgi:hypothetical protein